MVQIFLQGFLNDHKPILWNGFLSQSCHSIERFLQKKYHISSPFTFQFSSKTIDPQYSLHHYGISNNSTIYYSCEQKGGDLPVFLLTAGLITFTATGGLFLLLFLGWIPMFSFSFFEGFGSVFRQLWSYLPDYARNKTFGKMVSQLASGFLSILKIIGLYPFTYVLFGLVAFAWYLFVQIARDQYDMCDAFRRGSRVGKINALVFLSLYIFFQLPKYMISCITFLSTVLGGKTLSDVAVQPIILNLNNLIQMIYSAFFYVIPVYGQLLSMYHSGVTGAGIGLYNLSGSIQKMMYQFENMRRKLMDLTHLKDVQKLQPGKINLHGISPHLPESEQMQQMKDKLQPEQLYGGDETKQKLAVLSQTLEEMIQYLQHPDDTTKPPFDIWLQNLQKLQEQTPPSQEKSSGFGLHLKTDAEKQALFAKKLELQHALGLDFPAQFMQVVNQFQEIMKFLENPPTGPGAEEKWLEIIQMAVTLIKVSRDVMELPMGLVLDSPMQTQLAMYQLMDQYMLGYMAISKRYQTAIYQSIFYERYYYPSTDKPVTLTDYLKNPYYSYELYSKQTSEPVSYEEYQKDPGIYFFTSLSLLQKIRLFFDLVWLGPDTKGKAYSYDTYLTLVEKEIQKTMKKETTIPDLPSKMLLYAKSMFRYAFFGSFFDPDRFATYVPLMLQLIIQIFQIIMNLLNRFDRMQDSILEMGGIFEIINQIKVASSISIFVILAFIILLIIYFFVRV